MASGERVEKQVNLGIDQYTQRNKQQRQLIFLTLLYKNKVESVVNKTDQNIPVMRHERQRKEQGLMGW